jgi:hypothetical protein
MTWKGFFDLFMDSVRDAPKGKNRLAKAEQNYQWIREAKYWGQDTSLEPKRYAGLWKWLKYRIK